MAGDEARRRQPGMGTGMVGWITSSIPWASPVAFLDYIDAVAWGEDCLCALESP